MASSVTPGGVAQALKDGDASAVVLSVRQGAAPRPALTPAQLVAVGELVADKQRLHVTLGDGEAEVKAVVTGAAFTALCDATPGALVRLSGFGAAIVPGTEQKCVRGTPARSRRPGLRARLLLCANGRERGQPLSRARQCPRPPR